jgi:integrase/recombinase XerD
MVTAQERRRIVLTIYRRHLKTCDHRDEGRTYRRCKCPVWVDGVLAGRDIRQSVKTRDWQKASDLVHLWESRNSIEDPTPQTEAMTISGAWEQYVKDAIARELVPDTLRKYKQLDRLMQEFAAEKGIKYLRDFDVEMTRKFRATWTLHNSAAAKRLDYLKAFFRFAQDAGWVTDNPGKKLKTPQVVTPPTLPFSRAEVDRILENCSSLEVRAFVLAMRFSGLRISDTVSLRADHIHEGKLKLRTEKTNVDVCIPLPDYVIAALGAVKRSNGFFFWTGESRKSSVADTWRKRLAPVFEAAGIANAHPHRFRDTFACELLLAGVPIERVAKLLGHKSTRITEKHYSAWVIDRQRQLEEDVRRTWANLPEPGTKGTPEVHGGRMLVN